MKKILLLLTLLFASFAFSQTSGITYQAIVYSPTGEPIPGYNNANAPLANRNVCLLFTISDANSQIEYQEKITITTDEFGMVNTIIGSGDQTDGYATSFSGINWSVAPKSLKVALDTNGQCFNFIEISNQPFSYVPFAFAANSAANVTGIVPIANGGTNATTVVGAKTNLGLENVDNTSDLNKPVSIATQTALNLKENAANKSTDATLSDVANVKFPTELAVKTYVTGQISTANSTLNASIAAVQADVNQNELDSDAVDATLQTNINTLNTTVAANATAANSAIALKENAANKSTDVTLTDVTNTKFPTELAVKTFVNGQITTVNASNTALQATVAANATAANTAIAAVQADVNQNELDSDAVDATLQTNINTLNTTVAANATAANTAIAAVQADVNQNELDSDAVDATLQTNINALNTTVAANATAANTAIAAVQADVNQNELDSDAVDATLQTNINALNTTVAANATAANTAIAAVQADVNQNELDSDAVDATLQTNINVLNTTVAANATAANTAIALKENAANKSTDATLSDVTNVKFPTELAVKTFVNGQIATANATNANLTGVVTSTGNATAIANGAITNAMLANGAVSNLSGTNTGDQTNITGNAATATSATNVSGIVAIPNGGTGSATQNFVDLTTNQTIAGNKTFNANVNVPNGTTAIGTTTPKASAILDVTSTTKGFLTPRMTLLQRDAISNPANGLIIHCLDCGVSGEPQFYNGYTWKKLDGSTASSQIPGTVALSSLFQTTNGTGGSLRGQSFTIGTTGGFLKKLRTNAIGGASGTQLLNGVANSSIKIREYVNDIETGTVHALTGTVLTTTTSSPSVIDYNYSDPSYPYYPTIEFQFDNLIFLNPNTKYVIEFVSGNGVTVYCRAQDVYTGGQAYDIDGANLSISRDFPFELYLANETNVSYLPLTGGTVTGTIDATSFVKTGGTSSQFLMADGSTSSGGSASNLTGPITSSGSTTSVASQTGTGSTFVMSDSPTLSGTTTTNDLKINTNYIALGLGTAHAPAYSVAVGAFSGNVNPSTYSVSVGPFAGNDTPSTYSVSVGPFAGKTTPAVYSTSLGAFAGETNKGTGSVAIGAFAGKTNQGNYSIALGMNAGKTNQSNNSIILNASGSDLDSSTSGLFVNPIRSASGSSSLFYDTTTKEVTYGSTPAVSLTSSVTGILPIANGGTGSATQNFVDLTANQTIAGTKTFNSDLTVNGLIIGKGIGQYNDQNITLGASTLTNNTTGQHLLAFGNYALRNNTTANYNLAIGNSAMSANTTGQNNIAIGAAALASSATGSNNTAIGRSALLLGNSISNSTSLGFEAGITNNGSSNTFLGSKTDQSSANTSISNSTAIGYEAKVNAANLIQLGNSSITNVKTSGKLTTGIVTYPNTDGTNGQVLTTDGSGTASWATTSSSSVPYTGATSAVDLGSYDLTVNGVTIGNGSGAQASNVVLGSSALNNNTTGGYSVAVGFEALKSNTDGNSNTAIGYNALSGNTTGGANIAIGMNALSQNTIGTQNIAIGQSALYNNSNASANTVIGNSAGAEITTGGSNTIIGQESARGLSTGSWNTIIGRYAYTGNISNNIVLSNGQGGIKAQHDGTNWTLTGGVTSNGTFTGSGFKTPSGTASQFLKADGTVDTNSYLTSAAASTNFVDVTTNQTIAGTKTFNSDLTVNGLTIGRGNFNENTNSAIGLGALSNNTGYANTGIGRAALENNLNGGGNTAIGYTALLNNTLGTDNVAVGSEALATNISGSGNTAIGKHADIASDGISNSVVIGANATVSNSNTIQLGNSNITDVKTSGNITTAGSLLLGNLTSAQIATLTPTPGQLVYNTTTGKFQGYAQNSSSGTPTSLLNNASSFAGLGVSYDYNVCQSFTTTTEWSISSIDIYGTNMTNGNLTLKVYSGVPGSGILIGSSTMASQNTSGGILTFNYSSVTVPAGNCYWMLSADNTVNFGISRLGTFNDGVNESFTALRNDNSLIVNIPSYSLRFVLNYTPISISSSWVNLN